MAQLNSTQQKILHGMAEILGLTDGRGLINYCNRQPNPGQALDKLQITMSRKGYIELVAISINNLY